MIDLLFVAVILALTALTALFITACDRMIGTDEEAFTSTPSAPVDESERLAA
jgi:hypothetical protein